MTTDTLAAQIEALYQKWQLADDRGEPDPQTARELLTLMGNNVPAIVTALREAEAAPGVAEALREIAEGRTIRFTGSEHHNRPLRDKYAQAIAKAALARQHGARDA